MSTRGTILDSMATALRAITPANGYVSDVCEVRRDRTYEGSFPDTRPRLTLIDLGPDVVVQRCASGKVRSIMTIDVLAFVMGAGREKPPTDELDAIIGDIRKRTATMSLGSNVREVTLLGMPERFVLEREGVARFTIEVNYWYVETAP